MYEKIFFIGTGHVACECIKTLRNSVEMFTCLNVEHEDFPIVQNTCIRLNVEYRQFKKSSLKDFLSSQESETLIISAHNGYIFPHAVTDKKNITIINFHNAYLPHYRGRNAPTWEIYNDEKFGGATWHFVDSRIDTGKIIVQEKIPISRDETGLSLLRKSSEVGISLFKKNIYNFLGKIKGGGIQKITDTSRQSKLYLSHELPNGGYLDLSWDFEQAYRFLRAMDYRGMNVMPCPRIKLDSEIYFIEGYKVENSCLATEQKEFCIFSEKCGKFLRCQLDKCE